MTSAAVLILLSLWLSTSYASFNSREYSALKKDEIKRWDYYFLNHYLAMEESIILTALQAVEDLNRNIESSLKSIIRLPLKDLELAKIVTRGTRSESCFHNIKNHLDKVIQSETEAYKGCTMDTPTNIKQWKEELAQLSKDYKTNLFTTFRDIDTCAANFKNQDSTMRFKICIDSVTNSYFKMANSTTNTLRSSPAMSLFKQGVVPCAEGAAKKITKEGSHFYKDLESCVAISREIDMTIFAQHEELWHGYNATLLDQITSAEFRHAKQLSDLDEQLTNYFQLRNTISGHNFWSRGIVFYKKMISAYLAPYYNTVISTSKANLEDSECSITAMQELNKLGASEAKTLLLCNEKIVQKAMPLTGKIMKIFDSLRVQSQTSAAIGILACFSKGYIFAPDTIIKCNQREYDQFNIWYKRNLTSVSQAIDTLKDYQNAFVNGNYQMCDQFSLHNDLHKSDWVMNELERCLYIGSGTIYAVTTPADSSPIITPTPASA